METLAENKIRIYDELKSARTPLEGYWQDLMYYTLPRKAYITRTKNIGDRLPTDIYDSTAILANLYFAAGMQAYMSSPQTKWFTLGLKDQKLMTRRHILNYLRDTEDALYGAINNSNFYQEDVESYLGLGSIGTDIIYMEEDEVEDVRFDCLSIENVVIGADHTGRPNQAYMEFEFSSDQVFTKFGEVSNEKIKESFAKSDYKTKFPFLFCVYPREFYNPAKRDKMNMPYAAVWIDKTTKITVKESGYNEFPFLVSRFAKSKGDPYGYSPAMNVYADIKMLNEMEKTNILGAQMSVLPPLEIPDEAFLRPYDFNPMGYNIRATGYPNEHITPIKVGAQVPLAIEYIKYKCEGVQQAFYTDLFISTEKIGSMTATEVSIRNNQRMQLLGSAIGNVMREKLSPAIYRLYAILARRGKLPELPRELADQEYTVIYVSPLARAQRSLELQNFQNAMAIIGQFATAHPDALDNIDFDEATRYVADLANITPKVIRDDAEVQDMRDDRARQQAVAAQLATLQQGTEITKVATEADKNIKEGAKAPLG